MLGLPTLLCVLLLLLWGMAHDCRGETLNVERLLAGDSLDIEDNIGAVNAIAQDDRGFMWFGGQNGLARFDGHQVRVFRAQANVPNTLSNNYIWDMVVDKAGHFWLATGKGLNRFDPATEQFETFFHDPLNPASLIDNNVRDLALDQEQNLWLATNAGLSRFNAARTEFRSFVQASGDPLSLSSNALRCLLLDSRQRLWIGTEGGGLNLLAQLPREGETARMTSFQTTSQPLALSGNAVQSLEEDRHGNIWAGTLNNGITRFDADLTTATYFGVTDHKRGDIGDRIIQEIRRDRHGVIWVGTDHNGLARFDEEKQTFSHFRNSDTDPRSLYSNGIHSIFEDRDGDLWLGSHPKGVNYINRAATNFANFRHVPGRKGSLSHNAVISLLLDTDGDLWVGTEGGLNWRRNNSQSFQRFVKNVGDPKALQANPILTLAQAGPNEIWVGTWSGGLYRLNKTTEQFTTYRGSTQPGRLNSDFIRRVLVDSQQRVWIATENGGLNLYHPTTDSFVHWLQNPDDPRSLSSNYVSDLVENTDGKIWLATIAGINIFDPVTGSMAPLPASAADLDTLRKAEPTKIMRHSSGDMWVGTLTAGILVWHHNSRTLSSIDRTKGLKSNTVASLVEDTHGHVWAGTLYGVARIDPLRHTVKNFGKQQGFAGNNFTRDASVRDADGALYIGGTAGLSRFFPANIQENQKPPLPRITAVRVHNRPLYQPDTRVLPPTFAYDQNTWEFAFSALSYRAARSNAYQYRLTGYDADWSAPSPEFSARYSNLSPGRYVFEVKAANSDGVWSTTNASFAFVLQPPLWLSWWAYLIYVALGATLLGLLWLWQSRRLQLLNERSVNQELRHLHKMKDAFLANTSHELRTPLHGIIGLAESLASGDSGRQNFATQQSLLVIVSSGRRLAQLVNDILDFAKLNNRQLQLHQELVELKFSVDTTFVLLRPLATAKGIVLVNRVAPELPLLWTDANRLQQILFNLVGNAIKFTDHGEVTVAAEVLDGVCQVAVRDTGIGIHPAELPHIFSAFTQVAHSDNRSHGGTGLGLAICQQLVNQQGGRLRVSSVFGQGSEFSFSLPLAASEQQVNKGALISSVDDINTSEQVVAPAQALAPSLRSNQAELAPTAGEDDGITAEHLSTSAAQHPLILLVDDDPINRMVLSRLLSREDYQLIEAASGPEALQQIERHPDLALVILDVMMPHMSGYETCQLLRQTHPASRLPVIFLTAKDQADDRVRGLLNGGNDFLTKPVAKARLLAHVQLQLALTHHQACPLAGDLLNLQRLAPLQWALAQGAAADHQALTHSGSSAQRALKERKYMASGDEITPASLPSYLLQTVHSLLPDLLRIGCWCYHQEHFVCIADSNLTSLVALRRRQEVAQLLTFLEQRERQVDTFFLTDQERAKFTHLIPVHEALILVPAFFEGAPLGFMLLSFSGEDATALAVINQLKPCFTATLVRLRQMA